MNYSRRQLEALGEPLGDSVTRKKPGGRIYGGGGGGPTQTTVSASELPEWAKPYAQKTLAAAESQIFNKDAEGNILGMKSTPTYDAQRIADLSALQNQAAAAAQSLAVSSKIGESAGAIKDAISKASSSYSPTTYGSGFTAPAAYQAGTFSPRDVSAQQLQNYQMQAPGNVSAPSAQAATLGLAPTTQAAQFTGPKETSYQNVSAPGMQSYSMQAAQTGYSPQLQMYQMGGPERVQSESFLRPGMSEAYMSPYMQDVVEQQQKEAIRQSGIAGTQLAGQATQAGAFGGSRYGLMEAERQRNLGTQLGQIQAGGLQAAFQQAQQQFNAEQNARLQAQQANQAAGLNVGGQNLQAALGVQSLGTQAGLQTALANLNAQQQANVQNQAAQMQAAGMNAQQALQAALANQQAGMNTGQFNAQMQYNTGMQNAMLQQQANLANQSLAGQYGLAQGQLGQQANIFNAQQGLQAALANQQAGLTTGQQNLAALLGVQSLGAGQSLQAQLANQSAGMQSQQLGEQSRQFGAGQALSAAQAQAQAQLAANQLTEQSRQMGAKIGMDAAGVAMQGASALGNLGQIESQQQQNILNIQNAIGAQQQALEQQKLNQAYQDFLTEQNLPFKQLGFMSDLIRGMPLGQTSTQQVYGSPGSPIGQLAGLGIGAAGLSKLVAKEGGLMKSYAEGGVTDDRSIENILSKLSDLQLAQAKQAALTARDQNQLQMIEEELAERASMRRGLGSAPINFDAMMPSQQSMARGGIVAFADEGLVQDPMFDMTGGLNPESMEMDRLRVEALKAKRAEEEDRKRMEFLKTAAPDIYNRKMAEKPAAKVEPPVREREVVATQQNITPPAPKAAPKAPAKSISEAARIVTDVAKTQVPDDDVGKLYEDILAKMKSAPGPEAEALARMLNTAEKRAEDIKARGIGEALMKFGFGMAAQASKTGVARRSGLAGALESAAAASPILAESLAENEKLQAAAQDNALKLRLENARYQSAVESGNKQLAATLAGSISQRNIQQATLQAQIDQNARANALKEKEIAGLAAYRQQAGQSAIQKIADDLQAADPKLDRRSALTEASRISGYSFRSEQSGELQRMALLAKLRAENPMYKVLETQLSMAKTPEQQAAIQQKLTDIEQRAFGKLGLPASSGVGSSKTGWSVETLGGK